MLAMGLSVLLSNCCFLCVLSGIINTLLGERDSGFAFPWFVWHVLSTIVCVLFLLVSLVGYCDCGSSWTFFITILHI